MSLRDLDDKYLPALARKLDGWIHRIPDPLPEPTGPLPVIKRLRRLDDRWATSGPLALFRDIPQLGAVAVAALVLAGTATVKVRHVPAAPPGAGTAAEQAEEELEQETHLGPEIGESVGAYLDGTAAKLRKVVPGAPEGTVVAVLSFSSYRTPEQVRALVGPAQVQRIFYRAPLPLGKTRTQTTAVEDLLRDSRKDFARVAAIHTREGRELLRVAATIENDPAQKAEHEKDGNFELKVAGLLKGRCACIYGVVVRTKLRILVDLRPQPGVRAVDVSRVGGEIDDYDYTALLPEEKTIVTGGNQEPS
jgi:hypothetical protein